MPSLPTDLESRNPCRREDPGRSVGPQKIPNHRAEGEDNEGLPTPCYASCKQAERPILRASFRPVPDGLQRDGNCEPLLGIGVVRVDYRPPCSRPRDEVVASTSGFYLIRPFSEPDRRLAGPRKTSLNYPLRDRRPVADVPLVAKASKFRAHIPRALVLAGVNHRAIIFEALWVDDFSLRWVFPIGAPRAIRCAGSTLILSAIGRDSDSMKRPNSGTQESASSRQGLRRRSMARANPSDGGHCGRRAVPV